ncbi:hypothetical protein [Rhodococcoides yunnanense]|uniref:hypothetical protein n=1 Tax=Rhodococcoides yunnanense TaxID=278209 RepID=UPI001114A14D|nr:hypothetical protein [Rhodococcus yunnanensis]
MISRFRRLAAAAAIGAALSTGVIVPAATASAEPLELTAHIQRFNIHIRTPDGGAGGAHCVKNQPFGRDGSRCNAGGYFDDSSPAGFRNVAGGVVYDSDGKGGTYLQFYTVDGQVLEGNIPGRGSADFTIANFVSPAFGTLARGGQKLSLNVVTTDNTQTTGDRWFDFYLSGNLVVTTVVGSDQPGSIFDDFLDSIRGAFGSSE